MNCNTVLLSEIELPQWYEDFEIVRASLLEIDEDSINNTVQTIEDSSIYLSHPELISDLIVYFAGIREQNQALYAKIVAILSETNNIFRNYVLESASGFFLRALFDAQVFSLASIKQKLQNSPSEKIYFAPELKLSSRKERWDILDKKTSINELSANNWKLFYEIMENHCRIGSLEYALRSDDLDYFTDLASNINFEPSSELFAKAAFYGAEKVFRFLFQLGAKVTEQVTITAVQSGSFDIIRLCLQNNGNFETCLKAAAQYHHDEIFDWIYGTQNTKELKIHEFVGFMNPRAVLHTISRGTDLNEKSRYKTTCLHEVVKHNDDLLTLTLLKYGASPDSKDMNGMTPLHLAQSRKIVNILIEAGADIEARDNSGATPLFAAVSRNNYPVIRALFDKGANLNAINFRQKTVFTLAKEWNNQKTVDFLEKLGFSESSSDSEPLNNDHIENTQFRGYIILE